MKERLHQVNLFSQRQIYGPVGGQSPHLLQPFGAKQSLEKVADELIRVRAPKVIGRQWFQGQIRRDVKLHFERPETSCRTKGNHFELLDMRFARQGEQGFE